MQNLWYKNAIVYSLDVETFMDCSELGQGEWKILQTDQPSVFAHCCEWQGKTMLALHNLANQACSATLEFNSYHHLTDIFGDQQYEPLQKSQSISLAPYGYRWLRVEKKD